MGSRPEHVANVVVGSGFGGSVTAFRLAQAGQDVVLLERGKPYPPGSFARTPTQMSRNFWDPSEGLQGLFDIWSFRGIESVVSSGLGGGSLIYANVLLRKDENWFVTENTDPGGARPWPVSRADLEPHYDAVEQMIGVQRFPAGQPGYESSAKTTAFTAAADRLGLEWQLPPLAVSFSPNGGPAARGLPIPDPAYGNLHGLPRRTCMMTGACDLGCNNGAKNTLDHTYLSAAAFHGADLRTRCEVRSFAPLPSGGWLVRYVQHLPEHEGSPTATRRLPLHEITCDRLLLAAGTLGSTFLLLANRSMLPAASPMLGHRFSGNGDLLGFVLDAYEAGLDGSLGASSAPVITSAIRVADALDGGSGRGFYIEDAGYPGFVDWLVEAGDLGRQVRRWAEFAVERIRARLIGAPRSQISTAIARALGPGRASGGAMPLLGMGRDQPDGVMRLRSGYLDVDWTTETSKDFFDEVRGTMAELAEAMDGTFVGNPMDWMQRVITVHPLGGVPMGHDRTAGVVDGHGEMFGHPGLYVVDGSVMPGPVGANPSLTIAAFADRAAEHIIESSGPRTRSGTTRQTGRAPS